MKIRSWIVAGFLVAGAITAMAGTAGALREKAERGNDRRSEERRRPTKENILAFAKAKAAATQAKEAADVAASGNAFAINLYAKLAHKSKGNMFFSPASIHTALAMTYAGARGNTEKQMFTTLRFPIDRRWGSPPVKGEGMNMRITGRAIPISAPWSQDRVHPAFGALIKKLNTPRKGHDGKPAYELVVANALWGQRGYPFRKEFTKTVKANYDAGLEEVDYVKATEASRKKINRWVEKKTKQKIKDLIPKGTIDGMTRLVLTNAIYFKSNWDEKFEKGATKEGSFWLAGRYPVKGRLMAVRVPLMHQQEQHGYLETDTFQAVDILYKRGDLSMTIFLPKQKAVSLAAFEKTLTAKNLTKWLGQFKRKSVQLTLPKFKFTSQFGLADTLKAMGMVDAFSIAKADFSGMTTADKLFISAVIHKAFVAVDEEGTEAAAATAVAVALNGVTPRPAQPKVFKADHPFVFMIRHRATGSILFMGRVMNPKR
ncbi:MAG: serpin family protein [Phycisphaerae bacterium]|nr:serpin family protein [Phycisphaerae bacterium]